MIILSQDEETVVNFDNVTYIELRKLEKVALVAHFSGQDIEMIVLGVYSKLERAKEVLKDIIKAINGENFVEYNESTLNIHSLEQKVFYMPKE